MQTDLTTSFQSRIEATIKRILVSCVVAAGFFGSIHFTHAQEAKIYRVAVLVVGGADIPQIHGLRGGLKELGYVEGKNLVFDLSAKESYEEYRPLVKSYKDNKPDVIVTIGGTATGVVKEIAPEIPTVFYLGSDPVQAGFVKSIARPESNLTGLQVLEARSSNDFAAAFRAAGTERAQALIVLADALFFAQRSQVAEHGIEHRLPSMSDDAPSVEAGGMISYGANHADLFSRSAIYVDKILKGAKPAELPVEQPTKFELVINLKTAKQIGLTIPPNVLARVDRVIR